MNSKYVFIAVFVLILLSTGVYFYFENDSFKNTINEAFYTEQVVTTPQPVHNSVYNIIDPSGSGITMYAVPKITVNNVNIIIEEIASAGSGEYWLTYIDGDAYNNKVLHFYIPQFPKAPIAPTRKAGETKYKFDERMKKYNNDSVNYKVNLTEQIESFNEDKEKFLGECEIMINQAYSKKALEEDWSDIIGSVNAALRSLSTVRIDIENYHSSILLVSDGVQDLPRGTKSQNLNEIPTDISIVTVNNSGSRNNILSNKTIEVDNLDRAMNLIIKKPELIGDKR